MCTPYWNAVWNAMSVDGKFAANKHDADNQRRLDKIEVYFKKASELRFVAHAAPISSELGSLDTINASSIDTMVTPDNLLFVASGAGKYNNWTKAHYTEGAQLIDGVDVIIQGGESCDSPQGFQIRHSQHSLGEGTGSKLATLLLMKIQNNYLDRFTAAFSVYLSPKVSDVVVEANKATLSIHQFLEIDDEVLLEVLYNISHNIYKNNNTSKICTVKLSKIVSHRGQIATLIVKEELCLHGF